MMRSERKIWQEGKHNQPCMIDRQFQLEIRRNSQRAYIIVDAEADDEAEREHGAAEEEGRSDGEGGTENGRALTI